MREDGGVKEGILSERSGTQGMQTEFSADIAAARLTAGKVFRQIGGI